MRDTFRKSPQSFELHPRGQDRNPSMKNTNDWSLTEGGKRNIMNKMKTWYKVLLEENSIKSTFELQDLFYILMIS